MGGELPRRSFDLCAVSSMLFWQWLCWPCSNGTSAFKCSTNETHPPTHSSTFSNQSLGTWFEAAHPKCQIAILPATLHPLGNVRDRGLHTAALIQYCSHSTPWAVSHFESTISSRETILDQNQRRSDGGSSVPSRSRVGADPSPIITINRCGTGQRNTVA